MASGDEALKAESVCCFCYSLVNPSLTNAIFPLWVSALLMPCFNVGNRGQKQAALTEKDQLTVQLKAAEDELAGP